MEGAREAAKEETILALNYAPVGKKTRTSVLMLIFSTWALAAGLRRKRQGLKKGSETENLSSEKD